MLTLQNIGISYDDVQIVYDANLQLEAGEIGCLLGASGSGKTSLLRAIAGFVPVSSGRINIRSECVASQDKMEAPEKRRVAMMFQDLALFPHLNVFQNIAFGLSSNSKKEIAERVDEMLSLVSLEGMGDRGIHELSGGQQQRVALARALAPRPDMLLLDEPFSSLDTELRRQLVTQIRTILKQQGVTALLVTHDQQEAFAFADKIGIVQNGRILQWDNPNILYHQPESQAVAAFLGKCAFIKAKVHLNPKSTYVETEMGTLPISSSSHLFDGQMVELLIRPFDVQLFSSEAELNTLKSNPKGSGIGRVISRTFLGSMMEYEIELSVCKNIITVQSYTHLEAQEGQQLFLSLSISAPKIFPQ